MKAEQHPKKASEQLYPVKYSFLHGFSMYMRCMR